MVGEKVAGDPGRVEEALAVRLVDNQRTARYERGKGVRAGEARVSARPWCRASRPFPSSPRAHTFAVLKLDGLAKELVGHGHGERVAPAVRVDEDGVVCARRNGVACERRRARPLGAARPAARGCHCLSPARGSRFGKGKRCGNAHLRAQETCALNTSRCSLTLGPGRGWPVMERRRLA